MNSNGLSTSVPASTGPGGAIAESAGSPVQKAAQPILATENVTMQFGPFVALNNVSASFESNKLTAIIGPNGAGKSTFFNLVSGAFAPTLGRIRFQGRDITGMAQHEFARMGIAKSFQITNVFKLLSAHENVRVAAQMRRTRFELLRPRADLKDLIDQADALLHRVGLTGLRDKRAGDLAHGQPTAGMSPEETLAMMDLITSLAEERTVILVEHKMKLVMGICQRLVVLHHGEVLAEGTPDDIRTNDEVKRVYLGQSI